MASLASWLIRHCAQYDIGNVMAWWFMLFLRTSLQAWHWIVKCLQSCITMFVCDSACVAVLRVMLTRRISNQNKRSYLQQHSVHYYKFSVINKNNGIRGGELQSNNQIVASQDCESSWTWLKMLYFLFADAADHSWSTQWDQAQTK